MPMITLVIADAFEIQRNLARRQRCWPDVQNDHLQDVVDPRSRPAFNRFGRIARECPIPHARCMPSSNFLAVCKFLSSAELSVIWPVMFCVLEMHQHATYHAVLTYSAPVSYAIKKALYSTCLMLKCAHGTHMSCCWKTLFAKTVANESRANFISLKGPESLNKVGLFVASHDSWVTTSGVWVSMSARAKERSDKYFRAHGRHHPVLSFLTNSMPLYRDATTVLCVSLSLFSLSVIYI